MAKIRGKPHTNGYNSTANVQVRIYSEEMFMYPSLEMIEQIPNLRAYKCVPVAREIYADFTTPIEVVRTLKTQSRHIFLLESVEDRKQWGRYSFVGFNPKLEIVCNNGKAQVRYLRDSDSHTSYEDHKQAIRETLANYKSPKIENLPPFTGGLVGYFAYEYIGYIEPKLAYLFADNEGFNDVDLMLFDTLIAFDHFKQKIFLITNISLENLTQSYAKAREYLENLEELLRSGTKARNQAFCFSTQPQADYSQAQFSAMVQKAKMYIREGDIFQVVLSNPLRARASGSLFDVYRILRTSNPSPYMFYFASDELEIAGASPETLVKLLNGELCTYPLAGSRPRGKDLDEDRTLQEELLHDEKELSEHNMLVDLGRNDIGKVAKIGSVEVRSYMDIVKYSHIMHISSMVSGILDNDKDALDALRAILPAGTLSGAPKIRACEIIHELERNYRGIYGGAIGYLDFSGNMDTCIAIRLMYKKGDEVCIRAGAGIVIDSNPQSEFLETLNKAKAMVDAAQNAQGGIR